MEPLGPPPSTIVPPPPLTLGAILDSGFDLVRRHAALLIGLAALLHVPAAFLTATMPADPSGATKPPLASAALLVLVLIAVPIVVGGLTDTCGTLLRGRSADVGTALRRGLSLALPLVGTYLLFGLVAVAALLPAGLVAWLWESLPGAVRFAAAVAAGMLPFVVLVRLALLTQVAVLEERFGARALRRANALIDGQVLRVFGTLLVVGVLMTLLGGAAGLALGSLPVVGPAVTGLVQASCFAYTTAVGVVLYEDVRARRGEAPTR